MNGDVAVNCSSLLRYTFHMAVYTPPTAVMVGSLSPELGSIEPAIPVSSAVTRPSYAPTARPLSCRRLVRKVVPSSRSSCQYCSTMGGMPSIALKDCSPFGSTFGNAASADAYGPRANRSTSFMNVGKSEGTGETVTRLWNQASAASVGRSPTELPVCE